MGAQLSWRAATIESCPCRRPTLAPIPCIVRAWEGSTAIRDTLERTTFAMELCTDDHRGNDCLRGLAVLRRTGPRFECEVPAPACQAALSYRGILDRSSVARSQAPIQGRAGDWVLLPRGDQESPSGNRVRCSRGTISGTIMEEVLSVISQRVGSTS